MNKITKLIFFLVPLLLLVGFLALSAGQLRKEGSMAADPAVGRATPALNLPPLYGNTPMRSSEWEGKAVLVNFFASWCTPCVAEHAFISTLAAQGIIIMGVVYKDKQDAAKKFLQKQGNPFAKVGLDTDGRGAIEWGITGVPETFLVGPEGKIRAHSAGPLTQEKWDRDFAPHLDPRALMAPLPTGRPAAKP